MNNLNENITLITVNQYIGNINWYKTLFKFTYVKIEQYENYQKMSFRNRMVIVGSNGLINLTVPLQNGRSQKGLIKDVKIDNTSNWADQHMRSILACYGKSPFFEYYRDGLFSIYQKPFVYLQDLNISLITWVNRQLKYPGNISFTDQYEKDYGAAFLDNRHQIKPADFQTVELATKYVQVFEDRIGFQNNLSIIDLLFCCGPNAKSILVYNK
ncbi:MAG: WbqC family protein [Sediminibacterium sp.]